MEPEHSRPPLGDIFSPPRQALNEHNDYLQKVGLIVLIRGSPSHDLPRLIAENLAEIHGGYRTDFIVTQATISPFLVTCGDVHTRDAIVRRGIYTIPQARVQYTIHEWRPRFGMGYDPTTHKVWVKIVGLPLQAWTTPEITAILRSFGHPMQILPYGQEAGHFIDITALVATKSPDRIPLAYTYREGEYATKIDIIILGWRLWDESYFPPPGGNNSPHCPQSQPWDQAGPSNHRNRSPSSTASSAAPSEPTIDLSAWSPRSYQLVPYDPVHKKLIEERTSRPLESPRQREAPTHGRSHKLATPDPNLLKMPTQLLLLLYACLTAVPNPIAINPLRSFWTTNRTTLFLGEARKRVMTDSHCTPSLTRCTIEARKSTGKIWNVTTDILFTKEIGSRAGPLQPTSLISLDSSLSLSPAQIIPLLSASNNSEEHCDTADVHCGDPILTLSAHDTQQFSPLPLNPNNGHLELSDPKSLLPAMSWPVQTFCAPLTDTPSPPKPQVVKQRATPTRRSQRILEKRNTFCPEQKSGKKSKTQVSKIPFGSNSHLTPIDASKTLEILQATGLTINKKIEDIIDEAVKQDQLMEDTDQTRPKTPLHDPVPPLAVPGTDLLL